MSEELETRKIVINTCHGGFGLSHKAVTRFAELKGIDLQWTFSSIQARHGLKLPKQLVRNGKTINTESINEADWLTSEEFEILTKNIDDPEKGVQFVDYYIGNPSNKKDFYPKEIERTDSELIQVVEELGNESNGRYSELTVLVIPADVDYIIEVYDGREWVAETHRTWS